MIRNPDHKQPLAQWEEVDVTFPAVADTDIEVPHSLVLANPEGVYYLPVRNGQAAVVYHDITGTRRVWQRNQIYLRANVANAKVTLLLYVPHTQKVLTF
jgi:hypothetical protein